MVFTNLEKFKPLFVLFFDVTNSANNANHCSASLLRLSMYTVNRFVVFLKDFSNHSKCMKCCKKKKIKVLIKIFNWDHEIFWLEKD